jgi:hypothetical protein
MDRQLTNDLWSVRKEVIHFPCPVLFVSRHRPVSIEKPLLPKVSVPAVETMKQQGGSCKGILPIGLMFHQLAAWRPGAARFRIRS